MSTLVERLEAEAARTEFVETRDPVVLQGSRPKHPEPLRALLREAAAALRATGEGECKRDREADRQRFSDEGFNRWLDDGISEAGHIVWDAVPDVQCAWQGWEAREYYAAAPTPAEPLRDEVKRAIQRDIDDHAKAEIRQAEFDAITAEPLRGESRFFIDHDMVHDRKTGKHVGDDAHGLLALLQRLENERDAWRMTANAYAASQRVAAEPLRDAGAVEKIIAEIAAIERHPKMTDYWRPAFATIRNKLTTLAHPAPQQPDRIVLWSRGVEPNYYFIAERSKRPDINGVPVYETLDPITNVPIPPAPAQVDEGAVERAAIAITMTNRPHPDAQAYWAWLHDDEREKYRRYARAALAAAAKEGNHG